MSYINFRNTDQVVLYECELKGQISDGMWENSNPWNHWKRMCGAQAVVKTENETLGCVGFTPARAYNFANRDLVEWVGDRMRFYVAVVRARPDFIYEVRNHWSWGSEHMFKNDKNVKAEMEKYTLKDLRKDLRDMSKIVNAKRKGLIPE